MTAVLNPPSVYVDNEQETVTEALRRGASEDLLVSWLQWRRRTTLHQFDAHTQRAKLRDFRESLRALIRPQVAAYQRMVAVEFRGLKIRFSDPYQQRSDAEHYAYMRPRYYVLGYSDPVRDIFNRIHPCQFLGKNVPGGVHVVFANVLAAVPGILDAVVPGLADRVASCILTQDGGFVPRDIAHHRQLSNHAFGLAVDIDPAFNPHVVDKEVVAVLNEVVSNRKKINFSFDERYTSRMPGNRLLSDEGRTKVTFLYARMASDAVRDWLAENLDTYERCLDQISAGAKAAKGSNEETLAKNARDNIDSNPDLKRLDRITGHGMPKGDYPSLQTLHNWARYGIQTIPVELALAMEQAMKLFGFPKDARHRPWGQEWERSKDAMHFELVYYEAIPPDSPVRPLEALFPASFSPELEESILPASPELDQALKRGPFVTSSPMIRMPH